MKRFAAALLALVPLLALAEAYRWVDEQGRVHYGQVPPKGTAATPVAGPPPPASAPNQEALNQNLRASQRDEPKRQEQAAKAAQAEAQRQERCRSALDHLAYMDATPARRMRTTDAQGNPSRVTEDEYQKRRAEIQKSVDENCR